MKESAKCSFGVDACCVLLGEYWRISDLYKGASSALPATPASYEPAVYGTTATSLGGPSALPTGTPYGDQYIEQPSEASPDSAMPAIGKKHPDDEEKAPQYGMWLPALMCFLALVMLVLLLTYLVTSGYKPASEGRPSTSKWVSPAGHVGGLCNASSPCLGHGHCVQDICRCDGPHLTVVAGVCELTTTREDSTLRVTHTSDLDNSTLPTVQLFTHERTVRLFTDTDSDVTVRDNDEEAVKARVEEVRADHRASRTKSSNANHAKMPITEGSKERTQNQSIKRDATRSAGHPTERISTERSSTERCSTRESSNKTADHNAGRTSRSSANRRLQSSGSSSVESNVKQATESNPGRASATLGGSANLTSEHGASATMERREN
ncbi:hypothetical protein MTO96_024206 [Rhipicephalus appendiculatus]